MLRASKPAQKNLDEVQLLETLMKDAKSIIMTDYKGMTVSKFDKLRYLCFKNDIPFRVAKNRIVKIVLGKLGYSDLDEILTGPTGFCIGFDDPILPIRIISDFAKENSLPAIRACLIEGEFYGADRVDQLKQIPSRDVLLSQVVGGLVAPLSGFVYVINEILRSFVGVVDSLSQKFEEDGVSNEGLSATGGSVENLIEAIEKMTVLELVELKKALEEKFGVTAAAPVALAGAGVQAAAPVEEEEEQVEFDVILISSGDKKIQVIKEVRQITALGLKEAKALVDECPKPIKEAVSKDEAMAIKAKIEEVGGQVDIK